MNNNFTTEEQFGTVPEKKTNIVSKALSIKQPWASLIAHGIKDIENRTWKTNFRGRIYIHASQKPVPFNGLIDGVGFSLDQKKEVLKLHPINDGRYPDVMSKYINSAIIGEVNIVDCVINHHSIWAEKSSFPSDSKPIYNWVLANAMLYKEPILNVKGKLSFWEPDIGIQECIWCEQKFDYDQMVLDGGDNEYCPACWKEAEPILQAEYDEMVKNGEIEN